MFRQKLGYLKNDSCAALLSLLCLLSVGIWVFSQIIFGYAYYGDKIFSLTHWGLFIPCVVFLLLSLIQKRYRNAKHILPLSAVMLLWFLVVYIHRALRQDETSSLNLFLIPYFLALPYAAITQDKERQAGLKGMAAIYAAANLVLILYAIMLIFQRVPRFLQDWVFWQDYRLHDLRNANITACTFMIGIALWLGFGLHTRRKWAACLAFGIAAILFVALSLTNSRTALLATCLLIGGSLFFAIFQNQFRRFFPALVIAIIAMALLVSAFNRIFNFNFQVLVNQAEIQQPVAADTANTSPEAFDDTGSDSTGQAPTAPSDSAVSSPVLQPPRLFLNFESLWVRVEIWDAALRVVRENPAILLWGTSDPGALLTPACSFLALHTHNSWLEMLLRFGLPCFVISVVLTIMAIVSSFVVLFHKDADMWKKTITMLVLCLLISGFLEPYLYTAARDYYFINMFFHLCLGYLIEWARDIRHAAR